MEQAQDPTTPSQPEPPPTLLLRPEQRAPIGDGVKDLRPLTRAPFQALLDPAAYLDAPNNQQRTKRSTTRTRELTGPALTGMTSGEPEQVMTDPDLLYDQLADAVHDCVRVDHAESVIIGGGPLAATADRLQTGMRVPVIAPIPAACRNVAELLTTRSS